MTTNPLWDLIQTYMDDPKHRYPPKPADLARETGVSEQVLSKWKAKPVLPDALVLMTFSRGTGIPYGALLRAALEGKRYLPPGAAVTMPRRWEKWVQTSEAIARTIEETAAVSVDLEAERIAREERKAADHQRRLAQRAARDAASEGRLARIAQDAAAEGSQDPGDH